jgi:hypothetical protein
MSTAGWGSRPRQAGFTGSQRTAPRRLQCYASTLGCSWTVTESRTYLTFSGCRRSSCTIECRTSCPTNYSTDAQQQPGQPVIIAAVQEPGQSNMIDPGRLARRQFETEKSWVQMMPVVGASSRRATAGSPHAAIYLRVSTGGPGRRDLDRHPARPVPQPGPAAWCRAGRRVRRRRRLRSSLVTAGVGQSARGYGRRCDRRHPGCEAGPVRPQPAALLQLFERLDALGVRVLSACEGIDTRTPAGRMMLQLLGIWQLLCTGQGVVPPCCRARGVGRCVDRLVAATCWRCRAVGCCRPCAAG